MYNHVTSRLFIRKVMGGGGSKAKNILASKNQGKKYLSSFLQHKKKG